MANTESVRLDQWLWAARFFKTRSLAAAAAQGGKVHLRGDRAKPARAVRVGDRLQIRRGPYEWVVTVNALSTKRGPAREAALLYEETRGKRAEPGSRACTSTGGSNSLSRTGRPPHEEGPAGLGALGGGGLVCL